MNQQRKTIYALRRQVLEGRYAPEPSDEEKKKGKTAADSPVPTASGTHTVDSLAGVVRPTLARMVDALTQAPPPPPATPDAPAPPATPLTIPLDPDRLRSAIYRQYGAYPDTTGAAEDRTGTLDRLARDVASSLIQQRERLLDLCEEMLQSVMDEHCSAEPHADEWDLDGAHQRRQGALRFRAEHRQSVRSTARCWSRSCGKSWRR